MVSFLARYSQAARPITAINATAMLLLVRCARVQNGEGLCYFTVPVQSWGLLTRQSGQPRESAGRAGIQEFYCVMDFFPDHGKVLYASSNF
jgi:hypothetical protein